MYHSHPGWEAFLYVVGKELTFRDHILVTNEEYPRSHTQDLLDNPIFWVMLLDHRWFRLERFFVCPVAKNLPFVDKSLVLSSKVRALFYILCKSRSDSQRQDQSFRAPRQANTTYGNGVYRLRVAQHLVARLWSSRARVWGQEGIQLLCHDHPFHNLARDGIGSSYKFHQVFVSSLKYKSRVAFVFSSCFLPCSFISPTPKTVPPKTNSIHVSK